MELHLTREEPALSPMHNGGVSIEWEIESDWCCWHITADSSEILTQLPGESPATLVKGAREKDLFTTALAFLERNQERTAQ